MSDRYDPELRTHEAIEAARVYLVERVTFEEDTGCWRWDLSCSKGYGQMWHEGSMWAVHRFAYHFLVDYLSKATVVHHKCGRARCCNPDHLQAVSHIDNTAEMLGRREYVERIEELEAHIDYLCVMLGYS